MANLFEFILRVIKTVIQFTVVFLVAYYLTDFVVLKLNVEVQTIILVGPIVGAYFGYTPYLERNNLKSQGDNGQSNRDKACCTTCSIWDLVKWILVIVFILIA